VDETYVKVAGRWRYVYRAIDQFGQVIDVFMAGRRDVKAARWFFERAISTMKVIPSEVATDRAPTYPMCWRSWCRHLGAGPIGTPTTGWRPITVVSRQGCDHERLEAGPQRQGGTRGPRIRAEPSTRALRAGHRRTGKPAPRGRIEELAVAI
jgi:hypothetical protein